MKKILLMVVVFMLGVGQLSYALTMLSCGFDMKAAAHKRMALAHESACCTKSQPVMPCQCDAKAEDQAKWRSTHGKIEVLAPVGLASVDQISWVSLVQPATDIKLFLTDQCPPGSPKFYQKFSVYRI